MSMSAAKADLGSVAAPDAGEASATAEEKVSTDEMLDCDTCSVCAENGACTADKSDAACDKTCRTACITGLCS